MKILTKSIREQLLRNGRLQQNRAEAGDSDADFIPVVKLFTPDAACTWLLTELDPGDPDIAFGLCDLGLGCAELGSVRISEIESVRGRLSGSGRPSTHDGRDAVRWAEATLSETDRRRLKGEPRHCRPTHHHRRYIAAPSFAADASSHMHQLCI